MILTKDTKTTFLLVICLCILQVNMFRAVIVSNQYKSITPELANQLKQTQHLFKRELFGSMRLLEKLIKLKKEEEERQKQIIEAQTKNKLNNFLANRGNF